ncbi:Uncharacterized protein TPAR_04047 [Tolypocladium paradoxum]|uniref:Uncharacterized protein n=1 Tax=Tolypocladium paradoxum TaxID=94208 RepID=A0A2S4KZY9_9HYPO|nr:Uncharacterized protein TPAR_04047 [Tolypocladium paradoxum]
MAASFEEFDESAWDYGDRLFHEWNRGLRKRALYLEIVQIMARHSLGKAVEICPPRRGAFNVLYRVVFAAGPGSIIRFPIPAYFQYAEEKLRAEVAVMRYISDHTSIPIPPVIRSGTKDESPGGLGPFLIMEWVDNECDMADVLNTPGLEDNKAPVLDPNIDEHKLLFMYSQMADILLQISRCEFAAIGSLGIADENGHPPKVTTRPLSLNVSQLANFSRVPHYELPATSKTFTDSAEYYSALADMHLQQLSFQRNQAIESAADCRKKYIARQLFRKLAREGRLADEEFRQGPFKLWCDDLRPANVLVNKQHQVAAVVDWEFSYAAPAEFSFSPPWWLLLTAPEDWTAGLDDWAAHYEPRLFTFLRALEAKEKEHIAAGRLKELEILSTRMRESWESGRFWLTYAARTTWAFDAIFWMFLDEKFFGKSTNGDFTERLGLLPCAQVEVMEEFVARKLDEKEAQTLVDWYAPGRMSEMPPDILSVGISTAPGAGDQSDVLKEAASDWI